MKKFWNFKSKKYPKPFDDKILKETKKVISLIESMGVDFYNKDIIDIGCGTGIYGLVLAEKARSVLCLDFSKDMISVLKTEMEKNNIRKASYVISDFADFDDLSYEKKFDISFASMTPAIKTEEDILKMERLAKKWCVYIGWAGKRRNNLLDELYSFLEIKPYIPKGFSEVRKKLDDRKIKYRIKIFETSWEWNGSIEEAVEEFYHRIMLEKKEIDKQLIKNFLLKKFPDGNVNTETFASEGIIVWSV